jgi:C_GCAxxG_C_C family probable redox protein
MDIDNIKNKAVEYKAIYGLNCCQAVALALKDECDLDEKTIKDLTSGFAVGMGNTEATCGALIGANIIAGLKSQGSGAVRNAAALSSEFKKLSGATICKDLKGIETGQVLCSCNDCVMNAVLAYDKIIGTE